MAKLKKGRGATKKELLGQYGRSGVTAAEFNLLDGLTPTTTELNYADGTTSAIQTQLNSAGIKSWSDNVVSVNGPNDFITQSTSYIDVTGTSGTINVSNAGSRVVYWLRHSPHINNHANYHRTGSMKIFRGNTDLGLFHQMRCTYPGWNGAYNEKTCISVHIDHPNTTGNVTYKCMGKQNQNYTSPDCYFQHSYAGVFPMKLLLWEVNTGNNQSYNWS
jgi:hypothetical protein